MTTSQTVSAISLALVAGLLLTACGEETVNENATAPTSPDQVEQPNGEPLPEVEEEPVEETPDYSTMSAYDIVGLGLEETPQGTDAQWARFGLDDRPLLTYPAEWNASINSEQIERAGDEFEALLSSVADEFPDITWTNNHADYIADLGRRPQSLCLWSVSEAAGGAASQTTLVARSGQMPNAYTMDEAYAIAEPLMAEAGYEIVYEPLRGTTELWGYHANGSWLRFAHDAGYLEGAGYCVLPTANY
ncbi:MAG: hypothetical protein RIC81_06535 [Microcella pacifica]|uniref:hypothetical protein n=1 Tax=Microcella pacifica TaxID=2591847 RepID=UPI0033154240